MAENCALGHNGELKDTSDIEWVNYMDDDTAMNDLSASTFTQSSVSTTKLPLNAFSILLAKGKGKTLASLVGSPHCSNCTVKPSGKVPVASEKRAADLGDEAQIPHKVRKATVQDVTDNEDASDDEETDGKDAQAAHNHTKAFGDADHAICSIFSFLASLYSLHISPRPTRQSQKTIRLLMSRPSS